MVDNRLAAVAPVVVRLRRASDERIEGEVIRTANRHGSGPAPAGVQAGT